MKQIALLLSLVLLAACDTIPPEEYYARGAPESLLDVSSEVVNLSVASQPALDELAEWVNRDQPTRAELYCMEGDNNCAAAQEILDLYGVPSMYVPAADASVALVYERVLARDCEQRFIDRHNNPYNLNYVTHGCANAANMVQMVSDKQQFVSPNLMDYPDATKAVQAYGRYLEPPASRSSQQGDISDSALENISIE